MTSRITRIYTRVGDSGETSIGVYKLPKYHPCVHFLGSLDEAMTFIGLAIEKGFADPIVRDLVYIYDILSRIANAVVTGWCPDEDTVSEVERRIDEKPKPSTFIPNYVESPRGGGVASIAVVRAVIRRAERWFWLCLEELKIWCRNIGVLLNRLSDLAFAIQYQALLLEKSR